MSDYTIQFTKLRAMLMDTGNSNLVRDFYVQLLSIRNLNSGLILKTLDNLPADVPVWLSMVCKSDIRNIVVFIMWKEFQTVIDTKESVYYEESTLGTKIEELFIYLETVYYVRQIKDVMGSEPLSYIDWVKQRVEKKGLVFTVDQLSTLLQS
jgi:hypothetical protein